MKNVVFVNSSSKCRVIKFYVPFKLFNSPCTIWITVYYSYITVWNGKSVVVDYIIFLCVHCSSLRTIYFQIVPQSVFSTQSFLHGHKRIITDSVLVRHNRTKTKNLRKLRHEYFQRTNNTAYQNDINYRVLYENINRYRKILLILNIFFLNNNYKTSNIFNIRIGQTLNTAIVSLNV